MKNLEFKKYNRFFAFGCSFTEYYWPTWANIIAKEIPDHYIYAQVGAGNFYIFQALMEAIVRHDIGKNDLVMIMFSNVTREDRYTKDRGWITPGNLYFQNEYDESFLRKYLCHKGYLMRDLNLVSGCVHTLDKIGCDYELMSMVPFDSESSDGKRINDAVDVINFYSKIIKKVKPSVLETVFFNDWNSRSNRPKYKVAWQKNIYVDNHPTPLEYLSYLKTIYPTIKFSKTTEDFVNEFESIIMADDYTPEISKNCFYRNICARL